MLTNSDKVRSSVILNRWMKTRLA